MYLLSEENGASVLWRALANRFEKYFSFARLYKPSCEDLKVFGLEQFFIDPPALFVLVADEGNLEKVNAIHFDKSKQGRFKYTNVLFAINFDFRYKLPGENLSNQKTEVEMEAVVEIEAQRFEVQGQHGNKSAVKEENAADNENVSNKNIPETVRTASDLKDEL